MIAHGVPHGLLAVLINKDQILNNSAAIQLAFRGRRYARFTIAVSRSTLVRNLLEGQYENPFRIVAFNTAEGWSRDVTVDIADELRHRYVEDDDVAESLLTFMEAHWR